MRRAAALLLLLVPLALAACGGGGDGDDKGSGNPLVDAAKATAAAGSGLSSTDVTFTSPTGAFTLAGQGGYDHATDEGYQELTIKLPNGTAVMDEIFVRNVLWMKSPKLFGPDLPTGKQWLKYDVTKAGKDSGYNFKAVFGQTPADMLRELQRTTAPVETIGKETIDGEEMTHYRAAIAASTAGGGKLQALSKPVYKPVDAWVDDEGLVRQVRLDYTIKPNPAQPARGRVQLTMKLSGFGTTVDVRPPGASLVVDALENSGRPAPS